MQPEIKAGVPADPSLAPHVVNHALELFSGQLEKHPELVRFSDLLGAIVAHTETKDLAELDRLVQDFVLLCGTFISRIETEAFDVACEIVNSEEKPPAPVATTPFTNSEELTTLFQSFLGKGNELFDNMKQAMQTVSAPVVPILTGCNREAEIKRLTALLGPLQARRGELRDLQSDAEADLDAIRNEVIATGLKERLKFDHSDNRPKILAAIKRAEEKVALLTAYIDALLDLAKPIEDRLSLIQRRLSAIRLCQQSIPEETLPELILPPPPEIEIDELKDFTTIIPTMPAETPPEPAEPTEEVDPATGLTRTERLILAAYSLSGLRTNLKVVNVLFKQGFFGTDTDARQAAYAVITKLGGIEADKKWLKYGGTWSGHAKYRLAPDVVITWLREFFDEEAEHAFRTAFLTPPEKEG